jgi:type I restriction enzyme S subunit
MAQELYELPQGWEWKPLSELAKTTSGGTPKRSQKSYWGGNIPWVKSGELGDSLIQKNSEYITQEGLNNSSAKLFPKGALLIALYGATAGKLGILDFEAATNQAVCYINPDKTITFERYLWLFFSAIRQQIIEDSFGGAQPNISQSYLRNLQIPVPPLAEQERIVAKLDALFSRIDQAIAQLQHTQAQTKALFASVQRMMVTDVKDSWAQKCLNDLGAFSGGGTPSKSNSAFWGGKIPWITPKDMKKATLNDSEMKITEEAVKGSSAKMIPAQSVLIVARSGILRHTLPVCLNAVETTVNQDIKVFIPKKEITARYCQYMLKGHQDFILRELVKGGVTVESLKYKEFQSHRFPVPPLAEQSKIVAQLDAISERTQALTAATSAQLEKLHALKASLLDAAFRGQL